MVHDFFNSLRKRYAGIGLSGQRKAGFIAGLAAGLTAGFTSREKVMAELYGSIITLKNFSIVMKDRAVSADYILQMLLENSSSLKPAYEELLMAYRSGKGDEAFRIFGERLGSRQGKSFASILCHLEKINPAELVKHMEVLQSAMTEERITASSKKTQRNSIIISVWAAAAVFALLINFAVVAVFLDALEMLTHLF